MKLGIQTAIDREGIKYIMVDEDTGKVIKEYTEADEPVDFSGEIERAQTVSEADVLRTRVADLQQVVADMAELLLDKGVLP